MMCTTLNKFVNKSLLTTNLLGVHTIKSLKFSFRPIIELYLLILLYTEKFSVFFLQCFIYHLCFSHGICIHTHTHTHTRARARAKRMTLLK